MISLSVIRVPTPLLFILSFLTILFSPLCPIDINKSEDSIPCSSIGSCRIETNYTQLDPPILAGANGFTWYMTISSNNKIENFTFSANPIITFALIILPFLLPVFWIVRMDKKTRFHYVSFKRRTWRVFLWGLGFYIVVLSAYWSLNYMVFYGGALTGSIAQTSALIDPLFTSLLSTFLLFGLGLTIMMLAVRSRAIWPEGNEME